MNTSGQAVTVNAKSILVLTILSVAYLLLTNYLLGYKSDQLVFVGIINVCFYLSTGTRKFILAFAIFAVYWILFDYMKALPNYTVNKVSIAGIYNFDKNLWGIRYNGQLVSANEYWLINQHKWMDIVGGLFYLCWIPVPLGFAIYLFFTRKKEYLYFALTFFAVNLLGFVVYYSFPAAPPWYIQQHGFNFLAHTPGGIGGLARFDHIFHTDVFKGIYKKGSNVFAAMPSLHSAYPVVVVYYGLKNRLGWANLFLVMVMLGIWFTAVYASHHYIVDVLAGIVCAIMGILLFNIVSGIRPINRLLNKYEKIIT